MMRSASAVITMLTYALLLPPGSRADEATQALDLTDVFERAYASSFYQFDACGDPLSGRAWRAALVETFRHCPFSAAARARFQRRSAAQRVKAGEAIQQMIEERGGLPVRLEGMSRTCREQFDSDEYKAVQRKLEDYTAGRATAETVIAAGCDGTVITP